MTIGWPQALAWRMRRHFLLGDLAGSVADVVRRLGAVPAWSGDPQLAIALRRADPQPGDLERALADGSVIRTFSFRGATHLMAPEDAGVYLTLRSAGRQWELPSWVDYYDLTPGDWPALRAAVRDALASGPLTVDELGAVVTRAPRFAHLAPAFADKAVTLLKPFCWQGDVRLGSRDGRMTLQTFDGVPGWAGIPPLDEAGPAAVLAYFSTYGPATAERLQYWLGEGLSAGRKRLDGWLTALIDDGLTELDVDGDRVYLPTGLVDELASTEATPAVRLLPGVDQWVMGPGTADPHIVPPARRALVTRGANAVIAGGRVAGTWKVVGGELAVEWFGEAGAVPFGELEGEASRVGASTVRATVSG